jgi:hypothetical protein
VSGVRADELVNTSVNNTDPALRSLSWPSFAEAAGHAPRCYRGGGQAEVVKHAEEGI